MVLLKIKEYLPYLRMNKRLEKIELGHYARIKPVWAIMSNITTQLKEVSGDLSHFKIFSKVGLKADKVVLILDELNDLDRFFRLKNITTEVVEVIMDSYRGVFFTKNNMIR